MLNETISIIFRFLLFTFVLIKLKNLESFIKSRIILFSSIVITLISSTLLCNGLINWFYTHNNTKFNVYLSIDLLLCTSLIIDMKKLNLILIKTLESKTIDEAKHIIIHDFSKLINKSIIDTFVFSLLLTLGNFSEINEIRKLSQFGFFTFISNYFVFLTLYPALLSLIIQFTNQFNPYLNDTPKQSLKIKIKQTNPVTFNVKIVMCIFLILIHIKWNFFDNFHKKSKLLKHTRASMFNACWILCVDFLKIDSKTEWLSKKFLYLSDQQIKLNKNCTQTKSLSKDKFKLPKTLKNLSKS